MKAAVVQAWESARDEDLDRLFSTYLYRIARWSRGDGAPGFTTHDIGMFKGISGTSSTLTPANRYHLAAQAALPMLSAWGASGLSDRELGRCKFQLDAPLWPASHSSTWLRSCSRSSSNSSGRDSRLTWRPTAISIFQLWQTPTCSTSARPAAATGTSASSTLLRFCTTRTGSVRPTSSKQGRNSSRGPTHCGAEMLRVQFRSVDNRGRGEGSSSAFGLLRNANSGRVVNQLPPAGKPYSDGHEAGLVDILKEWSAP